jgi:hypothetical protein
VNRFEITRRQLALQDLSYEAKIRLIVGHLRRASRFGEAGTRLAAPQSLYCVPFRAERTPYESETQVICRVGG